MLDTFGAFGGVVAPVAVVAATTGALAAVVDLSVVSLSVVVDWPAVFLAAGLTVLAFAGAFALRVPARVGAAGDGDPDSGSSLAAYAGLFADRDVAAFVAVTVLFSFTYNGAVAFLPTYLVDAGGLSEATAGSLYAALFAVSVVQIATGGASDRVGRLPVLGATLALAAVGLAVVVAAPTAPLPVVGAGVVAFGLGSHGFRPVRGAYLVELVPDDVAGGALGVVRTAIMGVGAVAPATVGVLAERFDFQLAFGALLAALVGALLALAAVVSLAE